MEAVETKRGFVNSIRHAEFRLADDIYEKEGRGYVIEHRFSIGLSNNDDVMVFGYHNDNFNSFSAYGIINITTGQQQIEPSGPYEKDARGWGVAIIITGAAFLLGAYSATTFSWASGPLAALMLVGAGLSYRRRKESLRQIDRVEAVRIVMQRAKRQLEREDLAE
jgi:hypothetical protein